MLECGGVDGADLFERFGVWAGVPEDVGNQTRAVIGSDRSAGTCRHEYYFRRKPKNAPATDRCAPR